MAYINGFMYCNGCSIIIIRGSTYCLVMDNDNATCYFCNSTCLFLYYKSKLYPNPIDEKENN